MINRTFHGGAWRSAWRQRPDSEAKSPFELRVVSARDNPEVVRRGARHGDMGFLHSFTTGSTVDGPACASSRGRRAACGGASIATTPTRGR